MVVVPWVACVPGVIPLPLLTVPLGPSHPMEMVGFPGRPAAIVAVQMRVYIPPAVELPEVWMVTSGGGSVHGETVQIMQVPVY